MEPRIFLKVSTTLIFQWVSLVFKVSGEGENSEKIDTVDTILIHSANIACKLYINQWSHETMFVIVIFKVCCLRLWAPLEDFCPSNHLVPSPVDNF